MNKNHLLSSALLLTTACFTACNQEAKKEETVKNTGVELANFDTTVSPSENFYQYVNGNWIKNNPIPASESGWNSFSELTDKSIKNLQEISMEAAGNTNATSGSNIQKIGDFYFTGMDSIKLNTEGITPLNDELSAISNIKTTADLINVIAHHHYIGISPLFGYYITQDAKISSQNTLYITQAGIGLPDRDYYLNPDETSKNIRAEYLLHVQKMFELLGDKPAAAAKLGLFHNYFFNRSLNDFKIGVPINGWN